MGLLLLVHTCIHLVQAECNADHHDTVVMAAASGCHMVVTWLLSHDITK